MAEVIVTSAEERGVDQSGTRGIELRDEDVRAVEASARERRLKSPRARWEVGRIGVARYVGVLGRVDGDPQAPVTATAAEVGGVDEGRAGGIELRDEGVAATGRLEGPWGRREVAGVGPPGHVGVAVGVHRDPEGLLIKAVAAKVGGVDQSRTGGIELRHEDVGGAAGKGGLEGPRGRGKVVGYGEARHVGVAGGVHGDPAASIIATASEVGGVGEYRIDDQRPSVIIRGYLKADPLRAFQYVATFNLCPDAVHLLVDDGLMLAYGASRRVRHEFALGVDLQLVGALEAEHDFLRISSGGDDEVVFKLALVAVIDEVDPGIDVPVLDLGVGRDVGAPLRGIVADEVVRLSRELVEPGHQRRGRGTHEVHADHVGNHLRSRRAPLAIVVPVSFSIRVRPCEQEDHLAGGQIEAVAGTACEEANLRVRLAAIRLEVQGQLAVGFAHASVPDRGDRHGNTAEEREQREHAARRDHHVPGHGYLLLAHGRPAMRLCRERHVSLNSYVMPETYDEQVPRAGPARSPFGA